MCVRCCERFTLNLTRERRRDRWYKAHTVAVSHFKQCTRNLIQFMVKIYLFNRIKRSFAMDIITKLCYRFTSHPFLFLSTRYHTTCMFGRESAADHLQSLFIRMQVKEFMINCSIQINKRHIIFPWSSLSSSFYVFYRSWAVFLLFHLNHYRL